MDNIKVEKCYEESDLIEYKIEVKNEYANIKQKFYADKTLLKNTLEEMLNFLQGKVDVNYFEFGKKSGNFTPALSMEIEKLDRVGNFKIELDLEIDDNEERKHRCLMYVKTNLGELERFIKNFIKSINCDCGNIFELCGAE